MILTTIKNHEITKELFKSYKRIQKHHMKQFMETYNTERKQAKADKRAIFAKAYDVLMPYSGSQWMVVLQKSPNYSQYNGMQDIIGCTIAWNESAQGLRVYRVTDTLIEVFTQHFFERFNVRVDLKLHDNTDIIRRFFLTNGYVQAKAMGSTRKDSITSMCREGAALGNYINVGRAQWLMHKTFITYEQMNNKQLLPQVAIHKTGIQDFTSLLPSTGNVKTMKPKVWHHYLKPASKRSLMRA